MSTATLTAAASGSGSQGLGTAFRLVKLTFRGGASRSTLVLPIVAFGLTTALLLTVLAGALSFFRWTDEIAGFYQVLAGIAAALLVVPLLALGGSAARLSARRRDEKLSTLRLLGGTPALVGTMTVLESSLLAVAGALAGIVGYFGLLPLVAMIPFRGRPLGVEALLLNPFAIVAVLCFIALLSVVSAAVGLRRVNISPLGVRTRANPPKVTWLRIVLGAVVVVAAYAAISGVQKSESVLTIAVVLVLGFGGTLGVLNLMGPAVIRAVAKVQLRRAQGPAKLLAARQILESPKAAWRQVSGVAMTSFIAVFAGTGLAAVGSASGSGSDELEMITDVRTGVIITLVISFLMVACSVGVNQASQVLDRADLLVSMDRMGAPRKTMEAARARAVMLPLCLVALGSALIAAIVLFPLTALALLTDPTTVLVVALCLASGIALVWLSLKATAPVVSNVLRTPERF